MTLLLMHKYPRLIPWLITMFVFSSCIDIDEYDNNNRGNFETLWTIMDEHYCFFEDKEVNWTDVHSRYSTQVNEKLSRTQLFELLCNMIGELRDGHVNLSAPFDYGRNWSWKEDFPANFSDTLQRHYLGTDYKISNGISYRILEKNIGYMYVESFAHPLGEGSLDEILYYMQPCQGLIIDIRNNGGGMLSGAQQLAARFCNTKIHVGYMQHKQGPDHNDFSELKEQWIKPSAGIRWQKRVCVLTNRGVYSAANEFVKYMKQMPQACIIGDRTGGGAGMPYSAELPNGWGVRFSACPMFDVNRESTENGIAPDIQVQLTEDGINSNYDNIIEEACKWIWRSE